MRECCRDHRTAPLSGAQHLCTSLPSGQQRLHITRYIYIITFFYTALTPSMPLRSFGVWRNFGVWKKKFEQYLMSSSPNVRVGRETGWCPMSVVPCLGMLDWTGRGHHVAVTSPSDDCCFVCVGCRQRTPTGELASMALQPTTQLIEQRSPSTNTPAHIGPPLSLRPLSIMSIIASPLHANDPRDCALLTRVKGINHVTLLSSVRTREKSTAASVPRPSTSTFGVWRNFGVWRKIKQQFFSPAPMFISRWAARIGVWAVEQNTDCDPTTRGRGGGDMYGFSHVKLRGEERAQAAHPCVQAHDALEGEIYLYGHKSSWACSKRDKE